MTNDNIAIIYLQVGQENINNMSLIENEVHLYIGVNPKKSKADVIPTFTAINHLPIVWSFLFRPEEVVSRSKEFPKTWAKQSGNDNFEDLDNVEEFMNEPVAFRTSLPQAKARISELREAFHDIPYIWSYFRVIDILDQQLEGFIRDLEVNPTPTIVKETTPHPDGPRSQVKYDAERPEDAETVINEASSSMDLDNPFAELEDFGQSSVAAESEGEGFNDMDLLAALEAATELDRLQDDGTVDEATVEDELAEDPNFLPVVVQFNNIAKAGAGKRIGGVPLLVERLMHHARREGHLTRIMQDYLQDIFRECLSGWRITGLLAEDFVQGDPTSLADIMIGIPSPYVIIAESFDLEYWTNGTLQLGDERLMYTLTLLPSEEIHQALDDGKLKEIADRVGQILVTTKGIILPKLSLKTLTMSPSESNIWGVRVLLQDVKREVRPATFVCEDPSTSWESDFNGKINLPGVLEDWNVEFPARFQHFNDKGDYKIVFKGAKDIEETFQGFARWIRRHQIMYRNKFGVKGTVNYLKKLLEDTQDKEFGQLLFDVLTKITEFGINEAVEVLGDDAIVRKLPWLYS